MPDLNADNATAGASPRRLFFFNAGFLAQHRLRRILHLAGHELRLGLPGPLDGVAVWGRSAYAARGERIATKRGVPLVRIEDAMLRSVRPGRMGDAPLGLIIDPTGVHFDSSTPSHLEVLLAQHPLQAPDLLQRASDGIARLKALDLSKYNLHDSSPCPEAGFVLVIDQTFGDAAIRHSGASERTFAQMLQVAKTDHPDAHIVIKAHPETVHGLRPGHFGPHDAEGRITVLTAPVSPWKLLGKASAVYTVSSHLGFEAILAGHRPHVFGQPFYAGWGLSADRAPVARRTRALTKEQLFAAAMLLAPTWYDPCRDRLCSFEDAVDQLEAEVRSYREDRAGYVAVGMRLWKRKRLQAVFGRIKPVLFQDDPDRAVALAQRTGREILVWASKGVPSLSGNLPVRRVEDGFLRSRGLGAALVPPLSLVADDRGIYYDAGRESQLERLILQPALPGGLTRANALVARLVTAGLSKYNLGGAMPDLPTGHRILVPGQVEDDASIRFGAGSVRTNLGLLQAVRAANPRAVIVYKPHPDVEAGLRSGAVDASGLADVVARATDPVALMIAVDAVWTITSLLGFEALLRGKPVTCLGMPFYAGWGLTTDLAVVPARRHHAPDGTVLPRPDLAQLAYAALIAYPRYFDPVSRLPCPPEVALDRLMSGHLPRDSVALRLLSKMQGRLVSKCHWWR